MKINTTRFGEIEIEEKEIIIFEHGVPGFEALKKFTILKPDEDLPLSFLQSIEDASIAFIITDPFLFFPSYEYELTEAVQRELKVESDADVMTSVVLSIPDDFAETTANLLAPIVINIKERLGKQVILHQSSYATKHRLISLDDPKKKGDQAC